MRKIVRTGIEIGRGLYEERQARQARARREDAERIAAAQRETAGRIAEQERKEAEKRRLHEETMARMRGRIAVVTNFGRNTGRIAQAHIGKNIATELQEKGFEAVDILVIEALIHVRKADRLRQFMASAEALAEGALAVGLASEIHVGSHVYSAHPVQGPYLEPSTISDRVRHHEALNSDSGKTVGYIAAVSALELDYLGFPIEHTIMGATGAVYDRIVDGGAMLPGNEGSDTWQQVVAGNQLDLLPKEVQEADFRSRG